ncbi:Bacterial extracellular solute-binding proteins, family 3 [Caballeronia peredens]|nr:Bacterial extracellular solute-binding proteins, family 3 [Caballeronia peredens]
MFDRARHRGFAARASRVQWRARVSMVVVALSWALCVTAVGARERIVVGAAAGVAPPLDMAYPHDTRPRGISVDYVDAVARALDADTQWRLYPNRAALMAALARGDIDMATGATGADGGALAYSSQYLPIKQIYIEALVKGAPTHRLAYVDAQTSPRDCSPLIRRCRPSRIRT